MLSRLLLRLRHGRRMMMSHIPPNIVEEGEDPTQRAEQ
jgi:hypothetical protein